MEELRATRPSGIVIPRSNFEPPSIRPPDTRSTIIRKKAIDKQRKELVGADGGIYASVSAPRPTVGRRPPEMADIDVAMTSQQWLKLYGLKRQNLTTGRFLASLGFRKNVDPTEQNVSAREWSQYEKRIDHAVACYEDRLE